MKNLRFIAAKIIAQVLDGKSLSDCMQPELTSVKDARDIAFVKAVCFGVCRQFYFLDAVLELLLDTPLKEKDDDVYALLLVGLFQLSDMRIPDYAAIAETVSAVKDLKKEWARGLVNAILRNYQRSSAEIKEELQSNPVAQSSHPEWLIAMIQKAWPLQAQAILDENNLHPPLTLRVNLSRLTREKYLETLQQHALEASVMPETTTGIILTEPLDVKLIPGFADGDVSVQDGAAQLAVQLLELAPNQRVLDACAAPGGKTAHILESEPLLSEVVAIDLSHQRLKSVKETLERLSLKANCIASDVADTQKWFTGDLFDRILLDAPCSASGVIRRHPDIKLLRHPDDIAELAQEQLRLLTAIWPLLKKGGILLYATCSLFPRENAGVLAKFLEMHADANEEKITADWGLACPIGRQILPGMHSMDGFYYARLTKHV
jgi:16S rRNA (cytosine967-C5)-methyltransferase